MDLRLVGEAEWSKAAVLKTAVAHPTTSSTGAGRPPVTATLWQRGGVLLGAETDEG